MIGDTIRFLAAIRDGLLPKLLSGEIRVGQAEKIVEEVAWHSRAISYTSQVTSEDFHGDHKAEERTVGSGL